MFRSLMEPEARRVWDKGETEILQAYHRVWDQKPLLRRIYREWWDAIIARLSPGATLEVGAGIGEFRRYFRGPCVSTDIVFGANTDLLCDGQALPFCSECFANVVCVDVVHHVAQPIIFLQEVERVLRVGGRFVCVEPYASLLGTVVRRLFHHEATGRRSRYESLHDKDAWSGDLGMPTRLFFGRVDGLRKSCPRLVIRERCLLSMLLYALSGGFTYRSLVPGALVPMAVVVERLLSALRPFLALKALVVLERIR